MHTGSLVYHLIDLLLRVKIMCRGNALLNLGRFKEAITSYDKALELNPDQPIVLTNKGILNHVCKYPPLQ